jgi:DNA-binding IclR family transcriptional regulator
MATRTIPAVHKALDLLEMFSVQGETETTRTLAEKLDLAPATAFRIVQTLTERGYLRKDAGTPFLRLGPRIQLFAQGTISSSAYITQAKPFMDRLRDWSKRSVELTHYSQHEIDFVAFSDCANPSTYMRKLGAPVIAPTNPATLAVLAHLKLVSRMRLLKKMEQLRSRYQKVNPRTKSIVSSRLPDESELLAVVHAGFSADFGVQTKGITRIASPVFGPLERVIGTIGIVAPLDKQPASRSSAICKLVISEAKRLSDFLQSCR